MGDIDEDGKFYQCSIDKNIINPSNYDIQYTKYTKSYRFNDELNNKLDYLRKFMNEVYDDEFKNFKVVNYIKKAFKDNFFNKEDVIFNDNDIGISGKNDILNNDNKLTKYFVNKGTKPQYFIKTTYRNKNQLKGQQLENKPDHNNYEEKLFKTIHSFQGLDLDDNNKIISVPVIHTKYGEMDVYVAVYDGMIKISTKKWLLICDQSP